MEVRKGKIHEAWVVQDMFSQGQVNLQCVWVKREWKEALMGDGIFCRVLAILIFSNVLLPAPTVVSGPEASSLS